MGLWQSVRSPLPWAMELCAAEKGVHNALKRSIPKDALVRFGDANIPLVHYLAMRDRYDYQNGDY
jgi:hypothetical protein